VEKQVHSLALLLAFEAEHESFLQPHISWRQSGSLTSLNTETAELAGRWC
jgi:hypothetical protein